MKFKASLIVCLVAVMSSTAFAQTNFVGQFFGRYTSSNVALPPAPAQDSLGNLIRGGALPLSINDLIHLTLQNNLDISVNRLSPLSTQYIIESFFRPFEPTLRIGANVGRDTSPSRSQLSGAPSVSQLSHNYSIGFGQTLNTGTTLAVDFTLNRTSSNNAFSTFNPAWAGLLQYSVTQPLLRNFGRLANTNQIRIAQNNQRMSEAQFESQVIALVTTAQKTYWDLVFTAEDLKVKQRSLELAQKTLSDNTIQVNIGTLAPIDLVQAESEVATRREQLVVASHTGTQIEDQVKKFVTSQGDPGLVLAKLSPTQPVRRPAPGDVQPVEEAIRIALENRPEMRQLELELQNRDIDVAYARNQLLPQLNITASYTHNGVGGVETLRSGFGPDAPIAAINPGGLGDAFSQLFRNDFRGYSVGFTLEIPLSNRAQQAEHARAVTEKRIAENRIAATAQQIALEVRNAVTEVEMNQARIEAAEKARELAERRLDAEQKKFELGASTIRFVLEEQRNVAQAQTNEIAAIVNYTKALVDYERSIGMTLKNHNIDIEKNLAPPVAAK